MAFKKACELENLPEGTVKAVTLDGVALALTRCDGRYGALAGRCPHAGGPLGEGEIDFGVLICPWHGREFDPVSGECQGFAEAARAYPCEARADGVYVDLEG